LYPLDEEYYANVDQLINGKVTINGEGVAEDTRVFLTLNGTENYETQTEEDGEFALTFHTQQIGNEVPIKISTDYADDVETTITIVDNIVLDLEADEIGFVGEEVTLVATVTDKFDEALAGETVEFYIEDEKIGEAQTDDEGVATTTFTPTDAQTGVITVTAKLNNTSDYTEITVSKVEIVLDELDPYYYANRDENITGKVLINDQTAPADTLVVLTLDEDESFNALTDENGAFIITFNTETTGEDLAITVSTEGAEIEGVITIIDNIVIDFVADETGFVGEEVSMQASLTDADQNPLSGVNVEFYLGDELLGESATDADGLVIFTFTPTEQQTGQDQVLTAVVNNTEDSTIIDINTAEIVLDTLEDQYYANTDQTITGKILINQEAAPANTVVVMTLGDDEVFQAVTDDEGKFEITFNTQTTGEDIPIVVSTEGREVEDSITIVDNIVLDLVADETGFVGKEASIQATLTDINGNPLEGVTIEFFLGEEKLGENTTNANGNANFTFTPTTQQTGQDQVVTAVVNNTEDSTMMDIIEEKIVLNPLEDQYYANTDQTITGKVLINDRVAPADIEVILTLGDQTYTGVTDENGEFVITFNTQTTGENIAITLSTSSAEVEDTITIVDNIVIDLEAQQTAIVGEEVTIQATVTDKSGNTLEGVTVEFYLGDEKLGEKITDANGVASLTFTPTDTQAGQGQTLKVVVNSTQDTNTIDINKSDVEPEINQTTIAVAPLEISIGEVSTITATITSNMDITGGRVYFKV
ncbi:MAG: hypothetical protein BZ136_08280, partial [Methanosphaera sp. rholeuAM74]